MTGIMFVEELYKAIFDLGIKTQTRRTGGLDHINTEPDCYELPVACDDGAYWALKIKAHPALRTPVFPKFSTLTPKHSIGDVLYIKEPYMPVDGGMMYRFGTKRKFDTKNKMFMPARHARRFVEITGVRLERAHDITPAGCAAEGMGVYKNSWAIAPDHWFIYQFACCWESINGPGTWKQNPWVWVYQFKPLTSVQVIDWAIANKMDINGWVLKGMQLRDIEPDEYNMIIPGLLP